MSPVNTQNINKEFIQENPYINHIDDEIDSAVFTELGRLLREATLRAETATVEEEPVIEEATLLPFNMERVVDSAVHLLGSKQDIVHTVHRLLEDREEWDLAVMDGHGSTKGTNPYTGKYETYNLTLLTIQEMIENGKLDDILALDIYAEEDTAVVFQKLLSQKCLEVKQGMTQVGATFSLIQIRRDFITKKITVNILTVGDSPVTIHCNGEKVLESAEHSWINKDEMERLRREKRIDRHEISPSNNFKLLNEETIVAEPSGYVNVGPCQLAMTQSLGHIQYSYGKIIDEKGLFGLAPFKATMIFDETDELNIKGYSDGVSDVVVEYLPQDVEFLKAANATETAELAKSRWEKTWDAVAKTVYDRAIAEGITLVDIPKSKFSFGKTADDVCCVSWIQTRR